MKKIKLISSALGLTAIAGMMAPIITSCNNGENEKKEECKITFTDACKDAFHISVSRLPKNHDLFTRVTCDEFWSLSTMTPTVEIKVGDKILEPAEDMTKSGYIITPPSLNDNGQLYWDLWIDAASVVGDITIDVKEIIPVVPVKSDRGIYVDPIPVSEAGKGAYTVTMRALEDMWFVPTYFGYYGEEPLVEQLEPGNLVPGYWRVIGNHFSTEKTIEINLKSYVPGDRIYIGCNERPAYEYPLSEPTFSGWSSNDVQLWEGSDYDFTTSGSITENNLTIKLTSTYMTTYMQHFVPSDAIIEIDAPDKDNWTWFNSSYYYVYPIGENEDTIQIKFTSSFYSQLLNYGYGSDDALTIVFQSSYNGE